MSIKILEGGLIKAGGEIHIGKSVSFGKNIDIKVHGDFSIGDHSRLGNNVKIRGNNVSIGKHLYHSNGLDVGGGGNTNPTANLTIGDRCTIHDNYINIAEPVSIGNDVGFSREVSIQTHGYWLSVLEGFPVKFAGVTINDGVIIGYRTVILPGVSIATRAVIGACSVITKPLSIESAIYAGVPCKFIRHITPYSAGEQKELIEHIISEYVKIANFHGHAPIINVAYPLIKVNRCVFDVNKQEILSGEEDLETDHFRDYIRKWGLRFYTERPFRSVIRT